MEALRCEGGLGFMGVASPRALGLVVQLGCRHCSTIQSYLSLFHMFILNGFWSNNLLIFQSYSIPYGGVNSYAFRWDSGALHPALLR